jgi:hypothetical protein
MTMTKRWTAPGGAALRAGRGVVATTAALLLLGLSVPAQAAALPTSTINDPPLAGQSLVAFPARDFVSAQGYRLDERYTVEVHHSAARGGAVISSQSGIAPNDEGGLIWRGAAPRQA